LAFAVPVGAIPALRALGQASIAKNATAAAAALRALPRGREDRPRTPLDPRVVGEALDRILTVVPIGPVAQLLRSLSRAPREVDALAEASLVGRSHRLARLVDVDAPDVIIEGELGLIARAARALDGELIEPDLEERDVEGVLAYVAEGRFNTSLGVWGTVVEVLAHHLDELGEEPIPDVSGLALGVPLIEPPDFANPPTALERERFFVAHRSWLAWVVDEDDEAHAQTIEAWREAIASLDTSERRAIHESIPSDGIGPTPSDWLFELEAVFDELEGNRKRGREAGLTFVSRCERSL
jgi:hypothetical protein